MIPRYESAPIREIFSDQRRFERWTEVEVAACETWHARGKIPADAMDEIRSCVAPSPEAVREIERETNHDVVAFVRALTRGKPGAERFVHLGLTSSDIVDTAWALMLREACDTVLNEATALRESLAKQAWAHRQTLCMGRTHGVHAEPTTFGVRIAGWYTEFGRSIERLARAKASISHAKLSGAVGSFTQSDPEFEAHTLKRLQLRAEPVATQVVPRDRHAELLSALTLLGTAVERVALDIRHLQRTEVREVEEGFAKGQTGSSAMPHKRNPILSERLCGMARVLRGFLLTGMENVALWHERDISHSSTERMILPDAFHLSHYMCVKLRTLIETWRVYPGAMQQNVERTRGLVFSQSVLTTLINHGVDRSAAYSLVQRNAMKVWEEPDLTLRAAIEADADLQGLCGDQADEILERGFDPSRFRQHAEELLRRAGIEEDT